MMVLLIAIILFSTLNILNTFSSPKEDLKGIDTPSLDDFHEEKDSDGDGVPDSEDDFPFDPSEFRDSDGDGIGDNSDDFPFDPSEFRDSDGDGIGDNSDMNPLANLSITVEIEKFKVTSRVDWFKRAQIYFEIWINGERKQVFPSNGDYWRTRVGREEVINQVFTHDIPDDTKERYTVVEIKMYDHDIIGGDDPINIGGDNGDLVLRFDNKKNTFVGEVRGVSIGSQATLWYRVSHSEEVNPPEKYLSRVYRWVFENETYMVQLDIPMSKYEWCLNSKITREPQKLGENVMRSFVTYNDRVIDILASRIDELAMEKGFTDGGYIDFFLSFVQQTIAYVDDNSSKGSLEYWRYPIETLVEQEGDCEDTAVLFASLMKNRGFNVVLLFYVLENNTGHLAVGVDIDGLKGDYVEYNGEYFFYCETTSVGYHVGEKPSSIPDEPEKVIEI